MKFRAISRVWILPGILAASGLFAAPAAPVQPQSQPQEVHEEIVVDLVDVYLTAVDSKGAYVTDLRPEELLLTDDGVPQEISQFSLSATRDEEMINAIILIDTSVSMNELYKKKSKMDMAKDGAHLILQQLKEQDKTMLLTFSDTPAEATELTSDKKLVEERITALKTDYGRTALLDAVNVVADRMENEWGRKVVFICSDGQDNASVRKLPKVIERIKESPDLMIITLGITSFESSINWMGEQEELKQGEGLLKSLADASGGYAFFPKNMKDLDQVMGKLQRVITSQYSLAYHPSNPILNGAWRTISIACTRKGVSLRYRNGYFAK